MPKQTFQERQESIHRRRYTIARDAMTIRRLKFDLGKSSKPPAEVLFAAGTRLIQPTSTTAVICGDPTTPRHDSNKTVKHGISLAPIKFGLVAVLFAAVGILAPTSAEARTKSLDVGMWGMGGASAGSTWNDHRYYKQERWNDSGWNKPAWQEPASRGRARNVARAAAPEHHGSGNIHSKAGASASVAPQYAAAFQALIDDLEAHGAVIKFMGGYRPGGSCDQGHKHPCGMALDVCQYARDVVDGKCQLPGRSAENEIAAAHGLFHGAKWCNPDRGHFEVGGSASCGQGWQTATVRRRGHVAAR